MGASSQIDPTAPYVCFVITVGFDKKNLCTLSIEGLWLGTITQQRFIRFHNPSGTWVLPSGREGHCSVRILALTTAASPEILEKGGDSVIHSSIRSANEYVSEYVVMGASFCLMSSGAVCLGFDMCLGSGPSKSKSFKYSSSRTISAIPKSQICASSFTGAPSAPIRRAGA